MDAVEVDDAVAGGVSLEIVSLRIWIGDFYSYTATAKSKLHA